MKPRRSVGKEGHDRLTRIGGRLADALDTDPEYKEGDRCVVFLSDGTMAGTVLSNYGDPPDDKLAMVDVFMHMRAVFQAAGGDLKLISMPGHD